MALKFVILAALVAAAVSRPQYAAPQPPSYGSSEEAAKYDFDWSVKDQYSGNDFGQQEQRDGDYTSGSYYVQLPDGRLQTVTYTVQGDSGFIADVSYQGEAQYPEPQQYQPPKSGYN
ncbi:unnamed protein product [Meganyctiphanes norvegica]|uniref:Cuticle protein n=1 Tax=Meganyctiphanes norvegica TaxID=48144 RepID=A0AAV2RRQ2_MEGNR